MITEIPGETTTPTPQRQSSETRGLSLFLGTLGAPRELAVLVRLEANWDGYGAKPIDKPALALATRFVNAMSSMGLPAPEIFPVPDGGVQLEWAVGPMELEIEIEPGRQGVVFVGDDADSGRRFDGELPRDQALFAHAIANLLTRLGERPNR
jgi:hypothetical protein